MEGFMTARIRWTSMAVAFLFAAGVAVAQEKSTAEKTGEAVGSATKKGATATADGAKAVGKTTAKGAEKGAKATADGAKAVANSDAGKATTDGAKATGKATADGAKKVGSGFKNAVTGGDDKDKNKKQ
jgi:hypothetical protein